MSFDTLLLIQLTKYAYVAKHDILKAFIFLEVFVSHLTFFVEISMAHLCLLIFRLPNVQK